MVGHLLMIAGFDRVHPLPVIFSMPRVDKKVVSVRIDRLSFMLVRWPRLRRSWLLCCGSRLIGGLKIRFDISPNFH